MRSVKIFNLSLVAIAGIIFSADTALCISEGEKAPYFKVVSGNGQSLTLEALKGKTAVIFYETKESKEVNRLLKDELNSFYDAQPPLAKKDIERVSIIRCPPFMPNIWRKSLRDNSKKEGITIYGDWDGAMEKCYGMASGESNFLIIDKEGMVRYFKKGLIPKEEFGNIKNILDECR